MQGHIFPLLYLYKPSMKHVKKFPFFSVKFAESESESESVINECDDLETKQNVSDCENTPR